MNDTRARLTIATPRNEVCRFTIRVAGIDLTGVAMAMQVRLGPDVPGAPLIALGTVDTIAAEGLKLDSVVVEGGVPVSIIKGRINQSTMTDAAKVPYSGEIGDDTTLAFAMTWTIDGDTRTRIYGDFVVEASAWNSDDAPSNRPEGCGRSSRAGGASSGTLTFGDQVVHVSLSGVEQVAALIGKAGIEADRAVVARQGAETAAGEAGRSATAAAGAVSLVNLARDNALQTISTAQASFIGNRDLFETVAAGLAATAPDGYFGVAGGGEVAIAIYRNVNGTAVLVTVLPGPAALDRIGRFVPAVPDTDNSAAINAALADPLVAGVILPPGIVHTDDAIRVPGGKFLRGAGRGVTTIWRRDGTVGGDYFSRVGIITEEAAIGCRISDLTVRVPLNDHSVNGVWLRGARHSRVDSVEVVNASYSFWTDEFAQYCTLRDLISRNANVHFETTRASDILFENMIAEDGTDNNPAGVEAVWHCLAGSKRVTFRNGSHVGRGQPFLLVSNETGDTGFMDDIRYENLTSVCTEGKVAIHVLAGQGAMMGRVYLNRIDLTSGPGGISTLIEHGTVEMRECKVRGGTQTPIIVNAGASLKCFDPDIRTDSADGAFGSIFSGAGTSEIYGGVLEATSPTVDVGGTYVSPATRCRMAKPLYVPTSPGGQARYVYPVDMVGTSGTPLIGQVAGQPPLTLPVPAGVSIRVRFSGKIRKDANDPYQNVILLGFDGMGGDVTGTISFEDAAGNMVAKAAKGNGTNTTQINGVAAGTARMVAADFTIRGNGSQLNMIYGFEKATLLAGAEVVVERLS